MKKLVVTTSIEFSEEEKGSLKTKLFEVFGPSEVVFGVDEELLGGIIVFDGDSVYDASIKGKLARIGEALKK